MWLRISSSDRILSLPPQKHSWESLFCLYFVRKGNQEESSPPGRRISQHFTAQDMGSCNSLALNFGWCWFLLILSALSDNSLICSSDSNKLHRRGASPRSSQTCQRRIHSHIQAFPQRKFSVPRTFSLDNKADPGSQSSCLCKAGLSRHPRIALGGEDLRMALGQRHQPFCHPNLPARVPSHHTRAPQPGIRGSKNDTKPPLPHLNTTYAKSSLAGAEDQGP